MKIQKMSFEAAYQLTVAEGEGIGTAYEYMVKQNLIEKFVKQIGYPKKVLIAGLPEKYGFSLDFIYLCNSIGAEVMVVDERENKLYKLKQILSELKKQNFFTNIKLTILKITNWNNLTLDKMFDLAISCEVIQRLKVIERIGYVRKLNALANNLMLFAPNAENKAHARLSKLNTLELEELKNLCVKANYEPIAYGYIDLPPFPPGLTWKKTKHSYKVYSSVILRGLAIWVKLEKFLPQRISRRASHIIYFIGRSN